MTFSKRGTLSKSVSCVGAIERAHERKTRDCRTETEVTQVLELLAFGALTLAPET